MADMASDQWRVVSRINFEVGYPLAEESIIEVRVDGFDEGWVATRDGYLYHLREGGVSRSRRLADGRRESTEFRGGEQLPGRWTFPRGGVATAHPEWN